jgi:DNA-binding XRE family transcriptional regulator
MSQRKVVRASVREHFEKKMKNPIFRRLYEVESRKVHLGYMLHQLRTRAGLTQEVLAERVGVTQGYIARLETAENANYEMRTLKKIATALHKVVVIGFVEEGRKGTTAITPSMVKDLVTV